MCGMTYFVWDTIAPQTAPHTVLEKITHGNAHCNTVQDMSVASHSTAASSAMTSDTFQNLSKHTPYRPCTLPSPPPPDLSSTTAWGQDPPNKIQGHSKRGRDKETERQRDREREREKAHAHERKTGKREKTFFFERLGNPPNRLASHTHT